MGKMCKAAKEIHTFDDNEYYEYKAISYLDAAFCHDVRTFSYVVRFIACTSTNLFFYTVVNRFTPSDYDGLMLPDL